MLICLNFSVDRSTKAKHATATHTYPGPPLAPRDTVPAGHKGEGGRTTGVRVEGFPLPFQGEGRGGDGFLTLPELEQQLATLETQRRTLSEQLGAQRALLARDEQARQSQQALLAKQQAEAVSKAASEKLLRLRNCPPGLTHPHPGPPLERGGENLPL